MNTLRAKIALLLVVAIVSVVGILTWVMIAMLAPPPPQRTTEPLADQVEMFLRVAKQDTSALTLVREPSGGDLRENATARLRTELAERGVDLPVTISRKDWNAPLVVSIPIAGKGWLLLPIADLPPQRKPWYGLLKWLALITVGVSAIAIFAAHRMVQPLMLLENAVESVGPDAILPLLPEKGPAEVRATARALNSLSSRLRSAIESRMRLLAAAGHDLRTPITRMRLRAEFVEDEEERRLWLTDLDELERIADSAILLVREESGKTSPETLRLDTLVTGIAGELKDQNLDVTVTGTQTVSVRAGKLALSRALRNLMINAATHGRQATVSVADADGADGAVAQVIIEDEGPGIPPELLYRVFEPFFRVDPGRRQNIAGAGLGLTIAREIVQRASGDIRISNRDRGGLKQVVELAQVEEQAAVKDAAE
ncbi:ATP-binding protein [Methyloceanibacter sp.]|uniref:ATP-binding protein n=1 Tax=Methyloceanibacter sp. TaxID=1965321 RepID=UPI00351BB012